MHAPTRVGAFVVAASLLGLGCSGPEQGVVDSFFAAVQKGDESAAKIVSTVAFAGAARSWEIVEVGPQTREPFALPMLQAKVSELSDERRSNKEENEAFLESHESLFEQYQAKREQAPDYEFTGELADFQHQWEGRRDKQEELDHTEIDLLKRIDLLRAAAALSVNYSVDEGFEGDVLGEEVTVKVDDGSSEKNYTLTLQKFDIVDAKRNINPIGRWVITEINEADV